MNHADKAVEYFNNNFNCSQGVFTSFATELGMDESLWHITVMPGRTYADPNSSVPNVEGAVKTSQNRAYIEQFVEAMATTRKYKSKLKTFKFVKQYGGITELLQKNNTV